MRIYKKILAWVSLSINLCSAVFGSSTEMKNTTQLSITPYTITTNKFTVNDELKIVHLSDYHNQAYGVSDHELISQVKYIAPDMIVMTGDMLDAEFLSLDVATFNQEPSLQFLTQVSKVATTYFILGNNEDFALDTWVKLEDYLTKQGIVVLNEKQPIVCQVGTRRLRIIGIHDPNIYKLRNSWGKGKTDNVIMSTVKDTLPSLSADTFTLLVTHRPNYFDLFAPKADLVLAGHTHGGQIVLNGVPLTLSKTDTYIYGQYALGQKSLVVNRGLGTSGINLRINCPPEIGVITIKGTDKGVVK